MLSLSKHGAGFFNGLLTLSGLGRPSKTPRLLQEYDLVRIAKEDVGKRKTSVAEVVRTEITLKIAIWRA
jgi:hypothetical protein